MRLYHTIVRFNDEHPRCKAAESNLHAFKRTLSWAFVEEDLIGTEDGTKELKEARLLWRLATTPAGTEAIVQSRVLPRFHRVVEQRGNEGIFRIMPLPKLYEPRFEAGEKVCFSLTCHPSQNSTTLPDGTRISRRVLTGQERVEAWCLERISKAGLAVEDWCVQEIVAPPLKGGLAPTTGATIEGVGRVQDSDALLEAIEMGVGPEKAFGFGLLLVD